MLTAYLPVVSVFWAGGRPCSSERFRPENVQFSGRESVLVREEVRREYEYGSSA